MTAEPKKILVIDDEASMRHMLQLVLEREGYQVTETSDGKAALELLRQDPFDVVLCDIRMPGVDGLAFLKEASKEPSVPTIIMMSAFGTIDTAIECMKRGAYDYISKPFKPDEVVLTLKKAEERFRLKQENLRLRDELARGGAASATRGIIYRGQTMAQVMSLVQQIADSTSSVLVTGETGTGKELVARALHAGSSRCRGPFIAVNCSAITASLMESELFGHARGSFSGADRDHPGLFAAAGGGTLFLDEIGELPLELQPKLLRVLQEGKVRRVGETRERPVDVRVVAATGRDLKQEIATGRFRNDLYYRLAVVDIRVPPLRERSEDIPVLVDHFIRRIAARERRSPQVLTPAALEVLQCHNWPGNVRELENFVEKTLIFSRSKKIDIDDLSWEVRRGERTEADYSLKKASERLEQEYIRRALSATCGNRTRAAQLLEISLRGLLYKMKEYGIE